MKRVLLFASVFVGLPTAAFADESLRRFEVEATASTSYIYEREATIISHSPVVNVTLTWNQTEDFDAYVWVQAGDRNGQEVDIGQEFHHEFRNHVKVRGDIAAYFARAGSPTYTASVGTSIPVGSFAVDADVRRYEGAYRATVASLAVSREFGRTSLALGHAWNRSDDGERWSPTYAQVSYQLTDRTSISVRGFTGHGSGIALDLTARF